MSATNRNGLARQPGDFYETPVWAIDVVLDALRVGPDFTGYVVDPGCGTGAIAQRLAERAPRADVRGIELNPELLATAKACRSETIAWEQGDWLTWKPDGAPDLVIANPPYKIGESFCRKALEVVAKRGTVAMLMRSTFLIPKARRELRASYGLPDKYELEKRPSFNRSGTDATEYAWIVWHPKRAGRYSVVGVP